MESRVVSFLIPKKIVQNEIMGLLHFSSPKVFIYKISFRNKWHIIRAREKKEGVSYNIRVLVFDLG